MFIQATPDGLAAHVPEFTVIHAPGFRAVPDVDGTHSEVFIVVHFGEKLILIGGQDAGEIKKSVFSVMNFVLPQLRRAHDAQLRQHRPGQQRGGLLRTVRHTGWSGGPYGVGKRMAIAHTVPTRTHPVFGLAVPTACPNVPPDVLDPRSTWSDPQAYDLQANKLAAMFVANFEAFASTVSDEVRSAGPRTR